MTDSGFLRAVNVKKSYDQKTLVVKDFNLDVGEGEFITLLGPSGSGKTTVLMMLAGFESVTSGDILIKGQPFTRLPPNKRNIGMVFQNYALFPHMTIAENLAYPLTVRKMTRSRIDQRVAEYLKLIELDDFGRRYPAQLSGGQRQRVALARALIFEPMLVLMDEPLGALDKKLREQMQFEITRLHQRLGFTVVYVTHDQVEALTMSSRIAVFNQGVVQQYASPNELYERPVNAFVADFIGENNLIPGDIQTCQGEYARVRMPDGSEVSARVADCVRASGPCIVSVRPEKLAIAREGMALDNQIQVKFITRHYVGDFIRYFFELSGGHQIIVKALNSADAPDFSEGQLARVGWADSHGIAFQS